MFELYRDRREDRLKVSPALKVSRTKEAHVELPIWEVNLSRRTCYDRSSRSCIQQRHVLALLVLHYMCMLVCKRE